MSENQAICHDLLAQSLGDLLFKLREIEWVKGEGETRLPQQFTGSHVLIVATGGRGCLWLENHEYVLRQGAVFICPPSLTFGVESQEGLELFLLRFDVYKEPERDGHRSHTVREEQLSALRGEIQVHPAGHLSLLCASILGYWQNGESLERFRGQLAFLEMLHHIATCRGSFPGDSRTALERAKAYIEEHYAESLTIEQLARITELSPKYFVDLYKKTYGTSAMDYLAKVRINRAKQIMAKSNAKLKDIAHQVGYHDEYYFSHRFKKEAGVSPTIYMKSRRRKIAAYRSPIIGQMLALRMIPYAAPLHPKWTAHYHDKYRHEIPVHLSAYRQKRHWESNIELLWEARPDAIISPEEVSFTEKERLTRIAPTLFVPGSDKDWREQLRLMADYLGESAEAEQWICDYDQKAKEMRERLRREVGDETILVLRVLKGRLYAHSGRGMGEVLYKELQLNSAFPSDSAVYDEEVTIDQLAQLEPDRMFLLVCQEAETLERWNRTRNSLPWQELKAVRTNRAHMIASDPWREYSAMAVSRVMDEAVRLLSGDRPK